MCGNVAIWQCTDCFKGQGTVSNAVLAIHLDIESPCLLIHLKSGPELPTKEWWEVFIVNTLVYLDGYTCT